MRALPARPQHGMRLPPVLVIVGLTQLACCAFGRAVRSFPIVYGFSARRAEKPYTEGRTYHAAAGNKRGVVTPKNASAEVLNRTALVARRYAQCAYIAHESGSVRDSRAVLWPRVARAWRPRSATRKIHPEMPNLGFGAGYFTPT